MQPDQSWAAQPHYPATPATDPGPWTQPAAYPQPTAYPQAAYPPPGAPTVPVMHTGGPGYIQSQQPWMVPFNPNEPAAPTRRGPRKAIIIGLAAAVGLLGFGTAGANAYAKHSICSVLQGDGLTASSSSSGDDSLPTAADIAKMHDAADALRSRARLLVFDGDLRDASNGLAEDVDQIADVAGTLTTAKASDANLAQLFTVISSVNSHAREAQRACGLPVQGIFNN